MNHAMKITTEQGCLVTAKEKDADNVDSTADAIASSALKIVVSLTKKTRGRSGTHPTRYAVTLSLGAVDLESRVALLIHREMSSRQPRICGCSRKCSTFINMSTVS